MPIVRRRKTHPRYRDWLKSVINGPEAYGFADPVLTGFLRIVTHPGIFGTASPLEPALEFVRSLRNQRQAVRIFPGPRHWDIFLNLCQASGAKGNLIQDAYLAALAIESGSEWITTDGDFARFPDLRWRRPF